MAFQDKFRAFMFGLDAGVPACELAGEKVLLFRHVPLELESALARWLLLHEDLLHRDSAACALRFDEHDRMGLTWAVWGRFLDWMGAQLGGSSEGQGGPHDAAHALREGMPARTPISELHDQPVLYLDAAPVELRAALRHWLDASPEDFARHDDCGRAAITWEGWEAFLRSMKRTLSAALDALEQAREPASGA
ncbi:hypothetical protein G2912_21345 [Paraburkholderia aspalathi]|uniref:CdiI immunity protein domain-containing protein n=1 Tax=Paraburkholderia nemoris TaxID=2793076 RepID=A0ABM8S4E4_9BURK|nr:MULTISPECIES: hypothetical protein [Paraburkholderia]MBK3812905.1 hypothetical protein [Paraburkholderia aspalathi]CAE6788544.1 hypothetical protein R69776_04645 [Paraburkholderia nemoris]